MFTNNFGQFVSTVPYWGLVRWYWGVVVVVSDLSVWSYLFQLFVLQTECRDQRDGDEMVHHKLPVYVQNMDRLGDTELWDTNITVFTDDWLQLKWLSFFLMFIVLTVDFKVSRQHSAFNQSYLLESILFWHGWSHWPWGVWDSFGAPKMAAML